MLGFNRIKNINSLLSLINPMAYLIEDAIYNILLQLLYHVAPDVLSISFVPIIFAAFLLSASKQISYKSNVLFSIEASNRIWESHILIWYGRVSPEALSYIINY